MLKFKAKMMTAKINIAITFLKIEMLLKKFIPCPQVVPS